MKLAHLVSAPLIGAVFGAGVLALAAESPSSSRSETFRKLELFGDVLGRVQTGYVEDVDDAALIESAIEGMLSSLDPHSSYLNAEEFRDMQVSTRGKYGGLGIEVTMEDGLVKVMSPMDGTPADRAGIKAGDFLTAIDGKPILGLSLDEAVDAMRGDPGESITVTVAREGQEPFDVTLVREVISVKPVAWRFEDGDIGYVRVATFNDQAAEAVGEALAEIKKQNPNYKGVVLDLRDNPGGLLDQAIEISDFFLNGGEVVSTRGRDPRDIERYNAKPGDAIDGKPLIVLINGGSASAAEIVAGAVQDRKRGQLVGTTSFGKGSVQTVIPLRGGRDGALRMTTSTYYTPSGRSIQATGIEPDFEVAFQRGEKVGERMSEADLKNSLSNTGGASRAGEHDAVDQPPEGYPEDKDYQLQRAIDVLRGRMTAQGVVASKG